MAFLGMHNIELLDLILWFWSMQMVGRVERQLCALRPWLGWQPAHLGLMPMPSIGGESGQQLFQQLLRLAVLLGLEILAAHFFFFFCY